MSIRKKLIISNIAILFIPILAGYIIMGLVFSRFDDNIGRIDIYTYVRQFESAVARNNEKTVINLARMLEKEGYYIKLASDEINYESVGYQEMRERIVGDTLKTDTFKELILSSDAGLAYRFIIKKDGTEAYLSVVTDHYDDIIFSNLMHNSDGASHVKETLQVAMRCIVLVVIVTISGLTWFISRSILKPLKLLQEGTRQIKNGNLHYRLVYPEKDEFGAVCADFDDMRVSLLTLKEEEKKYDDNRKELIAGITHDLNTPLTSIKGFVSGLLEGIVSTPEKKTAYLKNIKQTADKMSALVEELLLYSTLDLNGVAFSFERVNLVAYFMDCLSELQDEYKRNGMDLHFITTLEQVYVGIDRIHFNRVVMNIIGNSLKYKKKETGNLYITLSRDDASIILSFKDDGTGIPQQESTDIFKVFYRSDKSRNQSTGGNGLGLAIVQRIVAAHGGDVKNNPAYHDGMEILITLPCMEQQNGALL